MLLPAWEPPAFTRHGEKEQPRWPRPVPRTRVPSEMPRKRRKGPICKQVRGDVHANPPPANSQEETTRALSNAAMLQRVSAIEPFLP